MIIRDAVLSDAEKMAEISISAWKKAYAKIFPPAYLDTLDLEERKCAARSRIINKKTSVCVAVDAAGELLGYSHYGRCLCLNSEGEIFALYVKPEYWAHGVGEKILSEVLNYLKSMNVEKVILWVFKANFEAKKFYIKRGFCEMEDESFYIIKNYPSLKVKKQLLAAFL